MMHYRKAENVEQELNKTDLPFENCMPKDHRDFLWMHVKGGTKLSNVVDFAKKALDKGEYRSLVWSGSGGGVIKTISCAEVMKRSYPLYQLTRMAYTNVEEHWKPQTEGLEEIIAKRQIPTVHILMSLDELPEGTKGVQNPNTTSKFWQHEATMGTKPRVSARRTDNRRSSDHFNMMQEIEARTTAITTSAKTTTETTTKTTKDPAERTNKRPRSNRPNKPQQSAAAATTTASTSAAAATAAAIATTTSAATTATTTKATITTTKGPAGRINKRPRSDRPNKPQQSAAAAATTTTTAATTSTTAATTTTATTTPTTTTTNPN